ncbi:MAG TPA: FG-GAP-like repeat-containing protein [Smithella sp.]|nr:FG-GAP-like repeat-containing protein [Smithella sp.]
MTISILGADGIKSGSFSLNISVSTAISGIYTFEFYVTDKNGSQSNSLQTTFTVSAPVSIQITPGVTMIVNGRTQQYTAMATFSDTSTLDVTNLVTWSSSDTNKATVDSAGLVTAVGTGTATITAKWGNISTLLSLTIVTGFAPGVRYQTTITSPYLGLGDTAIGDLNGDGRNDVAVIEGFDSQNRILIYYQNAQGSFDAPQLITTNLRLKGVAIADINNDGLSDLIVTGINSTSLKGEIDVFKQNPVTHALDVPVIYTLSASDIGSLAVADLNNDGLPDIVTFTPVTNGSLQILFQGAGGTLNLQTINLNSSIYSGSEIHVADMNSDGLNDIVVQSGPLQLAVIKQISPGIFNTTPDFYTVQTSYWPYFNSFALGDLNGDGRIDVAVGDPGNGPNLNIFYQNSSGTLTGPTILQLPVCTAGEVDIADLNGDGLNDLIILTDGNSVNIFYQAPDHSFPNGIEYLLPTSSTGGTPIHQALTVGDVTGDGRKDIVASWMDDGIFVLRQLP